MTEILIVTWDGGGNVPPALLIGAELARRGHGVRVLGHATQREDVTAAGLEFRAFPTARPFSSLDDNAPPRLFALFSDKALGADTVDEARRVPTDVVLVDCLLTGATKACADAGLTYVSLEHLFDAYLRGGWLKGPMGLVSRLKGLRPVTTWDGAARALVVAPAELDPAGSRRHPANLVHTGPALDLPASAHDLDAHPPAVLVSLSTYKYAGMADCLQRILDATAALDARVVVTTGPAVDPAELRTAPNHEVHRFVPHDELMPQMSLVVGHGGHATTMRALAHDLPLVVMPMHPMLDQPMVGKAVAAAGAGAVVAKKARPEELTPVISRLLADGPHRAAAARLGASIRSARGTETAADQILAAPALVG
ncbi:glycosyltransferase [Nocardioides marmoriginsengisoli]|uniref:Glycosyltransferase n=1 Tax=Nocardioides marmoriginsengisoli TaxID=661483 RepID=A0A3N0CI11_9ACTN|nr:nucleotide disphospho-sugar-binding domain-containing protein [Nocardioides marmoriginsengisoli]RNL63064.1 glycosyltransferase [Nocardioides marmoriginsengisoli]